MKANITYATTDSSNQEVTYGSDRFGPWLSLREKQDRWAIFGNCRTNLVRIRHLIQSRGISIPQAHLACFNAPQLLAA